MGLGFWHETAMQSCTKLPGSKWEIRVDDAATSASKVAAGVAEFETKREADLRDCLFANADVRGTLGFKAAFLGDDGVVLSQM